jgi:hypothetical protein
MNTIASSFIISAIFFVGFYSLLSDSSKVKIRSNPRRGGWSKKKIADYNKKTGSRLKPGVSKKPVTLEDLKRKGSWAIRHYKRLNSPNKLNMSPLKNKKGELLPFSTQAIVWGEKPPKTRKDQKKLVKLGENLLKKYQKLKKLGYKNKDKIPKRT